MAQATNPVPRSAGQPFTLGGVARYAQAGAARLLGAALVFGLISGASIALVFSLCCKPVLDEAISKLPDQSSIHDGRLFWPVDREPLLGANAFVSITAALEPVAPNASVDFAIHLAEREIIIHSLLGSASVPYPPGWVIELNRRTLLPLWGAWDKPGILFLLFGGAMVMIFNWAMIALPYAVAVTGLGAVLGKQLNYAGAWKLSVAAQWPGAVLLSFMLALYALKQITLVLLAGAFAAHLVLTVLYLFFSPIFLPQTGANPFSTEPANGASAKKNPFQSEE